MIIFKFHCFTASQNRSSCLQMFFRIGVLKNFTIFTGKHLHWGVFLIKLQTVSLATLLKRDSNTGVFLFLQNTSTRERCEICSKLTMKIPKRYISYFLVVFLFFTLNRYKCLKGNVCFPVVKYVFEFDNKKTLV